MCCARPWPMPSRAWPRCRPTTAPARSAWRDAEARLADWQQRWDAHSKAQAEAARAAMSNAPASNTSTGRSWMPTVAASSWARSAPGWTCEALSEAFAALQDKHDSQKIALDGLTR